MSAPLIDKQLWYAVSRDAKACLNKNNIKNQTRNNLYEQSNVLLRYYQENAARFSWSKNASGERTKGPEA